jgi:ATP-dependent 26S proteasome regulatory subunit
LVLDEETLETLQTTCAMLRDSEAWKARGVEVPAGLLLEGPSGTGKTQIARTIANEGGMGFVKANAAELKGMYLGHAAANVKEVFAKARAASPSILFIDEIDIVTPDRGGSGGDALVNEIISQMLQEMDGVVSQASQVLRV